MEGKPRVHIAAIQMLVSLLATPAKAHGLIDWLIGCVCVCVREREKERDGTPRRAVKAAQNSVLTEWQTSIFSSVVSIALHTRSNIPGPKSGLTVLTHSPWLFLNSYLSRHDFDSEW